MINNPVLGPKLQQLQKDSTGTKFFAALLPKLVGLAFVIGVLVFIFVLISGAIAWIFSGGEKDAVAGARAKISNGLIGLIVLFISYAIIKFIEMFFGISLLQLDIGGLKI